MTDIQLHGVFEEILVKFSEILSNIIIEKTEKNIKIDRINQELSNGASDLQKIDPDYWKLKIVRLMRQEIEARLRSSLYEIVDLKFQEEETPWLNGTTSSDSLNDISSDIQKTIEYQTLIREIKPKLEEKMFQLVKWVKENEKEFVSKKKYKTTPSSSSSSNGNRGGNSVGTKGQCNDKDPFLESLWKNLDKFLKNEVKDQEEAEEQEGYNDVEGDVYESISFDELNFFDDCNSMGENSAPSYEDIPGLIQNLIHAKMTERHQALESLGQVSILELVHSAASCFTTLCSNLMLLFLDPSSSIGEKAIKLMYKILNEIEDPNQFAEIYSALINFIVQHATSKINTNPKKKNPSSIPLAFSMNQTHITSPNDLRIINVYRFFHILLMRFPDHWIYLQTETLTQLFHGTFQLMFFQIGSNKNNYSIGQILSSLDPSSNWLSKWLLKSGSLHDQLLLSLKESHLLEDLLVRIAEFRPFTWTFPSRYEHWVYGLLLNIMETKAGRITVYNVWSQLIRQGKPSAMDKTIGASLQKIDDIKLEADVELNDRVFHRVEPGSNTTCHVKSSYEVDPTEYPKFLTGIFQVFLVSFLDKNLSVSDENKWTKASIQKFSSFTHEISQDFLTSQILPVFKETLSMLSSIDKNVPMNHHLDLKEEEEEKEEAEGKKNGFFPFNPFQNKIRATFSSPIWFGNFLKTGLVQKIESKDDGCHMRARILIILEDLIVPSILKNIANEKKVDRSSIIQVSLIGEILCYLIESNINNKGAEQDALPKTVSILQSLFSGHPHAGVFLTILLRETQLLPLLSESYTICAKSPGTSSSKSLLEMYLSLCTSSRGLELICEELKLDEKVVEFVLSQSQWKDYGVALEYQTPLLQLISASSRAAQILFKAPKIQSDFMKMISAFGDDLDFTLALQCQFDSEGIPFQLKDPMDFFHWILSILCTPFASQHVMNDPFWRDFISHWVDIHHQKRCWGSCACEDFCCLNLQMVLCLVISFRGMFDMNRIPQLDSLCIPSSSVTETGSIVTLCGLFESKLQKLLNHFAMETASFPSVEHEYSPQADNDPHQSSDTKSNVFQSIERLSSSIIESINESTNSSNSLDFAIITSNAWDMVDDVGGVGQPLERRAIKPEEIGLNLNTRYKNEFNWIPDIHKMLAEILCQLILSGKSKLEFGATDPHTVPHSGVGHRVGHQLGPDDRVRLNDIYKSTSSMMGLESKPTLLLQVIKKFGYEAKSCFVLSLLIIFGNSRSDKDILHFLTICHRSDVGPFLWISSGKESYQEEIWKFLRLSEVVEHVLTSDNPRLLCLLRASGISVFSLVERWYSQNFWGILPWKEILCYQLMVFIYGIDFMVYMAVALIHHLEPTLQAAITNRQPPRDLLVTNCWGNFRLGSWRKMITRLRNEHHEYIKNVLKGKEKK